MVRHWTLNGRFTTQKVTGVQRYAWHIVESIDALAQEGHPLTQDLRIELLAPKAASWLPPLNKITHRQVGNTLNGHLWEQIMLPNFMRGKLLSLSNTAPMFVLDQIVCIHDVNTFISPQSYSFRFRMLYRALLPILGRTAARIATVSNFSAEQLANRNIASRKKVCVIPNGGDHVYSWKPTLSDVTRSIANRDTVLIVGSPAPHKNIGVVLSLAEQMRAQGLRIAVIGGADPKVFGRSQQLYKSNNIHWLGSISDGELAGLLKSCLCLVFPSLTEGFGLPPLEAMALGSPVIVSNRASLPEVCGDAALYASPESPSAWFRAITSLRKDNGLRTECIEKGLARSQNFRWRTSAEAYLRLMAEVDGIVAPERTNPEKKTYV